MSSSKRFARFAAWALSGLGTAAIVAALALGLSGWPPAKASAAPAARPGVLGVGDRVSGPVTQLDVADKVGVAPESQSGSLSVPAQRTIAPVPAKKHTTAKAVRKPAGKVRHSRGVAKALGSGWRRARVSWYGPGFYGHTMAGGGKLTPTSMVVAHRRLPFGTRVQFNYHGHSVVAVVRDRGPFVGGREFDLGPGTAHALHFSGVGTVSYRILGR